MKRKLYGPNTTVLAIQSPPVNWHSLFQLEVRHCPCLDPVVTLVQYFAGHPHMDDNTRDWCKISHHTWYNATRKLYGHTTDQTNIYLSCVNWFCDRMLPETLPLNSTYAEPTEIPTKATTISHPICLCSNGTGQFMGISHCPNPVASLNAYKSDSGPTNITFKDGETVLIKKFLNAPAYKGIGFIKFLLALWK